uniref:Protein-tyrosine sulfotransferase n=1 Tax=Onchocerca volvulus TaxID=6282 RepID=A0A8R1XVD8_ONCVO
MQIFLINMPKIMLIIDHAMRWKVDVMTLMWNAVFQQYPEMRLISSDFDQSSGRLKNEAVRVAKYVGFDLIPDRCGDERYDGRIIISLRQNRKENRKLH